MALPRAALSPAPFPIGPLSPLSKVRKWQVLDRDPGLRSQARALFVQRIPCPKFLMRRKQRRCQPRPAPRQSWLLPAPPLLWGPGSTSTRGDR